MNRVTVVGSFAVGLTLRADRFPVAGETVLARDFHQGPGGKGSNQAVQAARLGAEVEFVGVIGNDWLGDMAVSLYGHEGVGTHFLERVDQRSTGVGFIVLDPAGENRILLDPGANDLLDVHRVRRARDQIARSDALLTQLEIAPETAALALEVAASNGVTAILNPAPARPLAPEVLGVAGLLTPNQSEARVLLGLDPDYPCEDADVCARLIELGVGTVVLTRGAQGALIHTTDGSREIGSFSVDVLDSTGAGDAFNGTLATCVARGFDLDVSVRTACAAGALACTHRGVIPSLPRRVEVEALLTTVGGAPRDPSG